VFIICLVKRVHWLRGRAIYQRWREEELLVNNEMQWTAKYFLYKSQSWINVGCSDPSVSPGSVAFAARQASQWLGLASRAQDLFLQNNSDYVRFEINN